MDISVAMRLIMGPTMRLVQQELFCKSNFMMAKKVINSFEN